LKATVKAGRSNKEGTSQRKVNHWSIKKGEVKELGKGKIASGTKWVFLFSLSNGEIMLQKEGQK